jgi:hypothetical protein
MTSNTSPAIECRFSTGWGSCALLCIAPLRITKLLIVEKSGVIKCAIE